MRKKYNIQFRFWIEENSSTFLAEGRIKLLKTIHKTGSLSKAAKSMNMSYRKAWELIRSINNSAPLPVVVTKTGGAKGGYTMLTVKGIELIEKYEQLQEKLNKLVHQEFKKIEF